MEFFTRLPVAVTVETLQRRLTIGRLPHWCASIETVLRDAETSGEIYSVWGTHQVNRETLVNGVRFSLPDCPNGLQWTVTTDQPPDPQCAVIHLTINRAEHDPDFIESIRQFVADWKTGLEARW